MFSVPSLNEPLVGADPNAAESGVPPKSKAEGYSGYEVLGPSSNWGSFMANGSGEIQ